MVVAVSITSFDIDGGDCTTDVDDVCGWVRSR